MGKSRVHITGVRETSARHWRNVPEGYRRSGKLRASQRGTEQVFGDAALEWQGAFCGHKQSFQIHVGSGFWAHAM